MLQCLSCIFFTRIEGSVLAPKKLVLVTIQQDGVAAVGCIVFLETKF